MKEKNRMRDQEYFRFIESFDIIGKPVDLSICSNGHINKTYIITTADAKGGERKYILQRINTNVFTKPFELMKNIEMVTTFLQSKIKSEGGDPERETLTLIKNGGEYFKTDDEGGIWRVYTFVPGTKSYDLAETSEMLENAGEAFGKFQKRLADFPASELYETIPHFHDTDIRYEDFLRAVKEDRAGRAALIQAEIDFIKKRAGKCSYITDLIKKGKIPLRVTHNDTKLNNVLIDIDTGEAICVVDLDTVMPGSVLYDFGDGIRFGASSAAEDERDLDKVWLRLDMFEAFVKGFVSGCDHALTDAEMAELPMGAYIITLETGMRFLSDYLNGDVYFAIHRENHNLDRARTQLKLVYDMESKMDIMNSIADKYR